MKQIKLVKQADSFVIKDSEEYKQFQEYLKWLEDNGVDHSNVKLVHLSADNRILCANRDIKKGECILSIPEKLFFQVKDFKENCKD